MPAANTYSRRKPATTVGPVKHSGDVLRRWTWIVLGLCVAALGAGAVHEVRQRGLPWEPAFRVSFRAPRLDRKEPATDSSVSTQAQKQDQVNGTLPPAGAPVFIRIFKEESQLELWLKGKQGWQLLDIYPVCRWSGTLGPKLREGDGQAPEGFYQVTRDRLNPNSNYHLAMNIGYPNAHDRSLGRTGSFIMIHGACVSIGCFAMTDAGIDDIYGYAEKALETGQAAIDVHIFPFRMTDENMRRHGESQWLAFWTGLRPAYEAFEKSRIELH
jgi:murein L,D-transpeptidase YafK